MFFKGSRYEKVITLEMTDDAGRTLRYKATRFIPETPARLGHKVQRSERLDHISQRYFRDPERFWRIADCNESTWPDELVSEPGRKINIPSSEG
ncbi:MAG TPA: hypothetical protein ENJ19_06250 [Gammaproteobacteria bacterium]|nr:hypothetical protein [Gammaproteobacteria bacterium]